jgi:hypothetical protein
MASIPAQEEFLAVTRKSQEAVITVIKTWAETVRTARESVYTPLADRLLALPSVSMPFADKLPGPEDAVASAYHLAEQLLANQRKFAEDLLKAMTPLMPGRRESAPEPAAQSKPQVPAQGPWRETAAGSEPKAAVGPVAASTPASPAPKSTPAKSTPAKSTPAKSTPAKSMPARSTAAKSTPARSAAAKSTAPKGTPAKSTPARSRAARPAAKSAPESTAPKTTAASPAPESTAARPAPGSTAAN